MKKFAYALVALAGVGALATAAYAASTNGNAYGKVRQPITITEVVALDFGEVLADGLTVAGSVDITPAGLVTTVGGTQTGVVATAAAEFLVEGSRPNATYVVTLPAAAVTLACVGVCLGADPTVGTFAFTSVNGGAVPVLGAAPTPQDTLNVGATMTFDGTLNHGDWAGTYVVDVVYN